MLRSLALILSVSVLTISGCDSQPPLLEVGGTVTYKKEPVKFGTISFRAEDGATGAAQIVDGKYTMAPEAGLKEGNYRVAISYPDPKIPQPSEDQPPGEARPNREMLPKKYNTETTLTAEIKAGADNKAINFDLE